MTQRTDVAAPALVSTWTVPITVRITGAIMLIIMIAICLTSYLNFVKFHKNLNNLTASRFAFVLTNLDSSIEASASIGVPLSALRNIQDLIERERSRDNNILRIDVTDEKGTILYSTDRNRLRKTASAAPTTGTPLRGVWKTVEESAVTLGTQILNSFDSPIGTLLIQYSTADADTKASGVLRALFLRSTASALAAMAVGLIGFYLVLQIFRRSVERMSDAVESLLRGIPPKLRSDRSPSDLEQQFEAFFEFLAKKLQGDADKYASVGAIEDQEAAFLDEEVPKFATILKRSVNGAGSYAERGLRYDKARLALAEHIAQFQPPLAEHMVKWLKDALELAIHQIETGAEASGAAVPGTSGPVREQIGLQIVYRLFGLTTLALMVPLALVSLFAVNAFRETLVPEMREKGAALAYAVAADVDRAVTLGIPLQSLAGAGDYLSTLLPLVPEARFIAISGLDGHILYAGGLRAEAIGKIIADAKASGDAGEVIAGRAYRSAETPDYFTIAVPMGSAGEAVGAVHVGISQDVLRQQTEDLVYDVAVLSLAGLLITFEVLLIVVALAISHPLTLLSRAMAEAMSGRINTRIRRVGHTEIGRLLRLIDMAIARMRDRMGGTVEKLQDLRASNLVFMRTPLFLFCFAEEFARSFFPLYVKDFAIDVSGLPLNTLIGLPISCFMFAVAIATPIAALRSDRIGRRPIFLIGAVISSASLILTALATSFWLLVAYRVIAAVGYAMVFIASQGYVFDNTSSDERTQGISVYVGAITAADLCGPPIGGIIADQLGFRLSFVCAAGIALLATLLAARVMHDTADERSARAPAKLGHFWMLVRNVRFVALVLFASVPAKLLLTGFLFFLVPLYLNALGESQSSIGRVIMTYALGNILLGPIIAKAADRWGLGKLFVVLGGLISGAALAAILLDAGFLGILIGVAGLGLGQAVSISPQLGLVLSLTAREVERIGSTTVISVFRIAERIGAASGPVVVGALLLIYDARTTIFILGLGSVVAMALLILVLIATSSRNRDA